MNRNTSALVALAALVLLVVTIGAAGPAAAQVQNGSGTITVANDTDSVFVDVTTVSDYATASDPNVTVSLEGLQEGQAAGEGVVLLDESRTLSNGTVESYEYGLNSTQIETYDRVEYTVTSSGDGSLISSVDAGTVTSFLGGGGGEIGSGVGSTGALAALVVAVAFLFMRGSS
ncbi:hypothetical protein DJ78_12200 [Halorubrum ezzemoulense]|uniref:Uncharacterized protein n=1 Tax=Halorubrum ezzemoulense TaxID=337243 RepID=A0A256JL95_HALEZ|nr:hypothetical protein DJ78_12200 [Halorubrum ezzemoulense]